MGVNETSKNAPTHLLAARLSGGGVGGGLGERRGVAALPGCLGQGGGHGLSLAW
jgi:hypothetical protein